MHNKLVLNFKKRNSSNRLQIMWTYRGMCFRVFFLQMIFHIDMNFALHISTGTHVSILPGKYWGEKNAGKRRPNSQRSAKVKKRTNVRKMDCEMIHKLKQSRGRGHLDFLNEMHFFVLSHCLALSCVLWQRPRAC